MFHISSSTPLRAMAVVCDGSTTSAPTPFGSVTVSRNSFSPRLQWTPIDLDPTRSPRLTGRSATSAPDRSVSSRPPPRNR